MNKKEIMYILTKEVTHKKLHKQKTRDHQRLTKSIRIIRVPNLCNLSRAKRLLKKNYVPMW